MDKLVRVYGKDGEEDLVLVHIEVQGQAEAAFTERMYVYNYRLFDRYRKPVVSLAVLGDATLGWRPDRFGYGRWGCEVGIRFPVVKLLDYGKQWEVLEQTRNPFAVVVMSHLKALETAVDEQSRYRWKLHLVKSLYKHGYGRQDILELFRFIDWLLQLPEALEEQFWAELSAHEEAQKMSYVTSVERIGIKKGFQQGIPQGEILILKRLLQRRFGPLPEWAREKLAQADQTSLETWADRVLEAGTLEEVFAQER